MRPIVYLLGTLVIVVGCRDNADQRITDEKVEKTPATPEAADVTAEIQQKAEEARKARKAPDMLITWANYDGEKKTGPDEAFYIVDGDMVGKGRKGFAQVLERLKRLSAGRKVYIYPEDLLIYATLESAGPYDGRTTVPFRQDPKLEAELKQVAKERSLELWYLSAPPGKGRYVTDEGEEWKVCGN